MTAEFLKDYLPIILFLIIALGLSCAFIILNFILSPKNPDPEKLSAYECGFEPFQDSRMEFDGRFYVDAIRTVSGALQVPGSSIEKLNVSEQFPWLKKDTQQRKDLERFAHFSDGFIARGQNGSASVADIRYSFLPNTIEPLWSIRLRQDASDTQHVTYETHREKPAEKFSTLVKMIFQ